MNAKKLIIIILAALLIPGLPLGATDYFNPADYQYNMTITGIIQVEDIEISEEDTLFAWAGEQCRGLISPKYESGYGTWYIYLVVHGYGESEEITFTYYNAVKDTTINLWSYMAFEIDRIRGMPGSPYPFSDIEVSVKDFISDPWVEVNQFENQLMIDLKQQAILEVFDLTGKVILHKELNHGRSDILLEGFTKSIYIIRISNRRDVLTRKILL